MNYSERTTKRKNDIARRVVTSWVIIGVLCFLLGSLAGIVVTRAIYHDQEKEREPPTIGQYITDAPTYGAFAGMKFDTAREWEVEDFDFVPLPDLPLDADIQEFAYYLAAAYEIDYSLILGMMERESSFNPAAISKSNDYGLLQINIQNFNYLQERVGVSDLLNPYDNIKGALYILRGLFEKYNDPARVLMAYNMGESGASKLWRQGVYESAYSRKVMEYQAKYIEKLNNLESEVQSNVAD